MTKKYQLLQVSGVLLMVLLLLIPFHAAFVTIIGAHISFKPVLQLWKEAIICIIGIMSLAIYIRNKDSMRFDNINWLVVAIMGLSLIVSLIYRPDIDGLLAGIKTNIIVLILFLSAQVISQYFSQKQIINLVVWPAFIVAVLAILQPIIFTPQFLVSIGYGADTIIATQYVEITQNSLRVFSTLGGPNQLGAYLIIPFSLAFTLMLRTKKILWLAMSIVLSLASYMTFSRSAWLGTILAASIIIILQFKKKTQLLLSGLLILLAISATIFVTSKDLCKYYPDQTTFFLHGDCNKGTLGGSDSQRLVALETGWDSVVSQPFGQGLGSAGPASFYSQRTFIVENWYLQIAIEIGLLGLVLYGVWFCYTSKLLYDSINNKLYSNLSTALIASLFGIALTALFLHSLADSTLSILLLALLGLQKGAIQVKKGKK